MTRSLPFLPRCAALVAAVLAVTASSVVFAQATVGEPWVRATVAELKVTGAFMTLSSPTATRLVKVGSPAAGRVELHESTVVDNVMRMRPVQGIDVPAGTPVQLKPGGLHVMLIDLKQPLKEGETVPLTLTFESGGKQQTVELKAPVRPLSGQGGMAHGAAAHDHGDAKKH